MVPRALAVLLRNPANFPPRHRFFYWLTFEDVSLQVIHLE